MARRSRYKIYFTPVENEAEAACLARFLSAPTVASAVSAYGAQLSLGASVAEYLRIPLYSDTDPHMAAISGLARSITAQRGSAGPGEIEALERHVHALLGI